MASLKSNLADCLGGLPSQGYVARAHHRRPHHFLHYIRDSEVLWKRTGGNGQGPGRRWKHEKGFSGQEPRIPPFKENTGLTDHRESQRPGRLTA